MTAAEEIVNALIEAEDFEDDAKDAYGDAPPDVRVANMRFTSRDEVNLGTKVMYRNSFGWNDEGDAYYAITGSDFYRVSSFWRCNPGVKFDPHRCQLLARLEPGGAQISDKKKALSTHVGIYGVSGGVFTWDEFFAQCVKPELYHPNMKMKGMPFNVPPDQRH